MGRSWSPMLAESVNRRRVLVALQWYSVPIHRGIARYAHEAGWVVDGGCVRQGHSSSSLDPDGIIAGMGVNSELDRCVKRIGAPVVSVGYAGPKFIACVAADGRLIGQMAAEHFRSRGFRHFAYFMWEQNVGEQQRWEGFRDALAAVGHEACLVGPLYNAGGLNADTAAEGFDLHRYLGVQLAGLAKPVAVFSACDDFAISLIDAAVMAGIRIPEQVAILGVDNDELRCPLASVPLSSIDSNEESIGYEAAKLLGDILEKRPVASDQVFIPPRGVVVRQSTNILAIPHDEVALALRLIWEHYTEPIDVTRVADCVPLSYPQLHAAFVKHVGHSMADELARRRIEHAQRLLSSTDMKISEVARLSGFGSADRIGRVFMRHLGKTPSEYREAAMAQHASSEHQPSEQAKPALLSTANRDAQVASSGV